MPSKPITQPFIGIDFGSTHARAWYFTDTISPVMREMGIKSCTQADYPTIIERIRAHFQAQTAPILMCGMIGSRDGWHEVEYLPLAQFPHLAQHLQPIPKHENIFIVPGLAQYKNGRYDVMRGEETQLLGSLAHQNTFSGHVVMPGTHCKWVSVKQGTPTAFQTYMTGELFALLSQHSLLSALMTDNFDENSFHLGLAEAKHQRPLSATLFYARAKYLLENPYSVSAFVSGLLIGSEFYAHPDSDNLYLIDEGSLGQYYQRAAKFFDIEVNTINALDATTLGLNLLANWRNPHE